MKTKKPTTLSEFVIVESLGFHQSISMAAEELGISPSALSRQLSSLESKLEARLFNRDTRNFSLTETGREFKLAAEKVLSSMYEAMESYYPNLKYRVGRLTIASIPSISSSLLPKLMVEFFRNYPGIDVKINDLRTSEIIETVINGDVDIGFSDSMISLKKRLNFIPIFKDNFIIISGKFDFSTTKSEYRLEEITELPLITPQKGTGVREVIDSMFDRLNLNFVPQYEVSHISTAMSMVSQGLGIMLIPITMLHVFELNKFKFHSVSDHKVSRQIGIVYRHESVLSPASKNFIEHTKKNIHSVIQYISDKYPIIY